LIIVKPRFVAVRGSSGVTVTITLPPAFSLTGVVSLQSLSGTLVPRLLGFSGLFRALLIELALGPLSLLAFLALSPLLELLADLSLLALLPFLPFPLFVGPPSLLITSSPFPPISLLLIPLLFSCALLLPRARLPHPPPLPLLFFFGLLPALRSARSDFRTQLRPRVPPPLLELEEVRRRVGESYAAARGC
jgi:hypothetical protein